ncbi:MAG: hypothetical protein PGN11_15710 [Quadrisphaera sp.]
MEESTRSASTTRTSTPARWAASPRTPSPESVGRLTPSSPVVLAMVPPVVHHRDERPRGASAGGGRHEMARQPR